MSDMLQRVGAAILEAESQWTPKSAVSKERAMALAAIEAMREPTEDMYGAGNNARSAGLAIRVNTEATWRAMIDAALTPPE